MEGAGELTTDVCSSVVRAGATGAGAVNAAWTGELSTRGGARSRVGEAWKDEASETDRLRRFLVEDVSVGLRMENPRVPKTLLFLRLAGLAAAAVASGRELASDSAGDGTAGSAVPCCSTFSSGAVKVTRPLLVRGLLHHEPIQSPIDDLSDLELPTVSKLGALTLMVPTE